MYGSWGFIMEEGYNWSYEDANVTCRQLGYKEGIPIQHDHYGDRVKRFALISSVNCTGNESSLFECEHDGIKPHFINQNMNERAAVLCSNDESGKI